MPWPFGGISWIRWPRNSTSIVSRKSHRVRSQVVLADVAAAVLRRARDLRRDLAAIEIFAFRLGDLRQRLGLVLHAKMLARFDEAPVRHEGFGKARLVLQPSGVGLPDLRDDRRDEEAVARIADRRFDQGGEGQLSVTAAELDPGGDGSRNGGGVPALVRHCRPGEERRAPGGGRAAGGVEADELRAVPKDGEEVAAEAVPGRFHDGQSDRRRDCGVDGIAALGQHREPGLRCQRLGRRDAIPCEHRHTARRVGEIPVGGSRRCSVAHWPFAILADMTQPLCQSVLPSG